MLTPSAVPTKKNQPCGHVVVDSSTLTALTFKQEQVSNNSSEQVLSENQLLTYEGTTCSPQRPQTPARLLTGLEHRGQIGTGNPSAPTVPSPGLE